MQDRDGRSVARGAIAAVIVLLGAQGAHAQGTYIGAAALADISRFGSAGGGNGETFGAALRVGTGVTDRWGVDLEFTRTGTLEDETTFDIGPLLRGIPVDVVAGSIAFPGAGAGAIGALLPAPIIRTTTTQQFATLTAMPWVRQYLTDRAELVYLGGVAFVRTERTTSVAIGRTAAGFGGRGDGAPFISYTAAPAVGLDVRIAMTPRLQLVPGVRLLVVGESGRSGWLTRPSLGLQWTF